ncbi:MAG: aldo/keto reductase family protein [Planctomycetota bacterium]
MQYRRIGQSGLKVSVIGLGTWLNFGGRLEQATETDLIDFACELGINFFDTADVYKGGAAEISLGKSLAPYKRSDLVIASKVYFPTGEGPNDRGLSRKHIFESIAETLDRLGTPYLDLYQAHRYDEETSLEEVVRAFGDLVRMGKIHYWGVSMWSAKEIRDACRLCKEFNLPLPISNQPVYNLLDRRIEREVVPVCRNFGLGILPYSPLAQGALTGKYLGDEMPDDSRGADDDLNKFMGVYLEDLAAERIARMKELSEVAEIEMAHLALGWCLQNDLVASVIVGVTKAEQLEQNSMTADTEVPDGTYEHLAEIFQE